MKVCVVIQARMTSTRLPGKVLMDLCGKSVLRRVIERVALIKGIDHIVVAIPEGEEHLPIAAEVKGLAVGRPLSVFVGSEDNVLERTLGAVKSCGADIFLRITSDCPFVDPEASRDLLQKCLEEGAVYARFNSEKGYPLGFDTEVVFTKALEEAAQNYPDAYEREHATPYIWRRPDAFPSLIVTGEPDHRSWRLVIDEPRDYEFAQALQVRLEKRLQPFTYDDICDVLNNEPELLEINGGIEQKAMIGRKDAK